MTQVLKTCLKLFFGGPGKFDFRTRITLNVKPDCHPLVFARFGVLIQDADAHARSCGWRGAQSTKACPLCTNIVKKGSAIAGHGFSRSLTTINTADFKPLTQGLFNAFQHNLRTTAVAGDLATLAKLEKDYGFNYCEDGWLQDLDLSSDFVHVVAFDWMHCFVENGVFNGELEGLLDRLQPYGFGCHRLHQYLQK